MIIFIILTVAIAHTSLLLQIKPKTKNIKYSMIVTIFFISTVTLMLIRSTLKEYDTTEIEGRLIGVLFILDVLGTVVTPIFNRIPVKKD
jgi:membrane protein CcdC involved in cytochrome C biogenesis